MSHLSFDWDEHKNQLNFKKHGITFEEAITVFYDDRATEFYDDKSAEFEDRFLLLGFSAKLRMLLLCYCLRCEDSVIRIISARKATKNERKQYGRI
jgi:uncharacterized protein